MKTRTVDLELDCESPTRLAGTRLQSPPPFPEQTQPARNKGGLLNGAAHGLSGGFCGLSGLINNWALQRGCLVYTLAALSLLGGGEAEARSAPRVGFGVSSGPVCNPWVGGRGGFCGPGWPGFCGPGYPGRGGVVVVVPGYDPWWGTGAWNAPVYPNYYSGYDPGDSGLPPFPSRRGSRGSVYTGPGPVFTPPAYTPLEDALEQSRQRERERIERERARARTQASRPPASPGGGGPSGPGAIPDKPRPQQALGYPSGPTPTGHPRTYRVQKALKELGYYTAGIDGQLGPATQASIRTYQIDRGLPVTGKINAELETELGLSPDL